MLDVAAGLSYLHSRGILHRDIKAPNVLVDQNWHAKVCDFGISLPDRDKHSRTSGTGTVGTRMYLPPEVILTSMQDYNVTSEIYSYALFCFECETMQFIFNCGYNDVQAVMGKRPIIPFNVSLGMSMFLEQCWAHDPQARWTWHKIRAFLREYLSAAYGSNRKSLVSRESPDNSMPMTFAGATPSPNEEAMVSLQRRSSSLEVPPTPVPRVTSASLSSNYQYGGISDDLDAPLLPKTTSRESDF